MTMTNDLFSSKELGDFKSYKEVLDFVPRSVWEINGRTKEVKDIFQDDLEKHICERTSEGFPVSIKQKFSVFNPILGGNILKIWSNIGDNVIDPFAGRDRALITNYMNRHYTGYEISTNTFDKLNLKIENWKHLNKSYNITLQNLDGTKLIKETENSFDFSYSCPPYWFKEKYESVPGQISDLKTEDEWKKSIECCAENLKICLKKDKFAVFVIADIRDKGRMIPLHSHWIECFQNKNWDLKDIIINKTNPMNSSGINGFLRNHIMQKSHEYLLVFKNVK